MFLPRIDTKIIHTQMGGMMIMILPDMVGTDSEIEVIVHIILCTITIGGYEI